MVRVLIVDDSAYMRYVLRNNLDADPDITVVDTARDGLDALDKIAALKPDVVTLDLEMPRMDGFAALKRIMAEFPTPVIILSSLSQEGADATIRALRLGAVDFVPKPIGKALSFEAVREELLGKIKQFSGLNTAKLGTPQLRQSLSRSQTKTGPDASPVAKNIGLGSRGRDCRRVVVIGTSTGGPRALHEVVPQLPASLPAGVLIVQHMPPGFTRSLAQRLNDLSPLEIKEAEPGDVVQPGLALVAPGNYHMTVSRTGVIALDQRPPEHGVRPAVDVTMETTSEVYGGAAIGVILTGMGCDGTRGAKLIKEAGGQIVAEDESTCVIYGMPRSVIEAGVADRIAPLHRVADEIVDLVEGKNAVRSASS
ncbi:MAG: chemotaxis response regulator protein-glutamate methylesterase [Dehalococcoidales bacterium]|nr:chemotaxis response regulator protein-glutamate methylesterase [Dehalococcoidales bacterium]